MIAKPKSLNDREVVVYALFTLGGWQERIHTEDIAIKCFQLAPSKFSWVKHKEYPDIMTAWYALGDAKKEKYGSFVVGGSERKKGGGKDKFGGWRLTEAGIGWINENKNRIEAALSGVVNPDTRLLEDRRLKILLKSKGYNQFLTFGEKSEISNAEFAESLICTVITKPEELLENLEQLYSSAEMLKQENVKRYLEYCRRQFSKQLTRAKNA